MSNTSNVTAAKPKAGGAVSVAALGTDLSAYLTTNEDGTYSVDPTVSLGTEFTNLGYISEDGLTMSNERESEEIKAWGGDTVLTTQTGYSETASFTLIEALNADVLKQVYGEDNVTENTGNITIATSSDELPYMVYVIDMVMSGGKAKRIIIPKAKVTEVGETAYTDSEAVGFETTLSIVADDNSKYHYEGIATA